MLIANIRCYSRVFIVVFYIGSVAAGWSMRAPLKKTASLEACEEEAAPVAGTRRDSRIGCRDLLNASVY